MGFDIEKFVSVSKAVDLSDMDWEEAGRIGMTDEELRILRFISDTEMHTIIYLRDLLAGHTACDPEVITFLSCWVYEETHHGRALDKLMAACGHVEADRYTKITEKLSMREEMTGALSRFGAWLSPHFAAAHMCWGAINEATAAATYLAIARRTKNPQVAKLVSKLAKDERKHFSFYYHQCEKRLEAGGWKARWLCDTTIRRFWKPVGIGVGTGRDTLDVVASYCFGDERGHNEMEAVDETVRKLPGMDWFRMVSTWQRAAEERFALQHPADFRRHRDNDPRGDRRDLAA